MGLKLRKNFGTRTEAHTMAVQSWGLQYCSSVCQFNSLYRVAVEVALAQCVQA